MTRNLFKDLISVRTGMPCIARTLFGSVTTPFPGSEWPMNGTRDRQSLFLWRLSVRFNSRHLWRKKFKSWWWSFAHLLCLQIHKPGDHQRLFQLLGDRQWLHASSTANLRSRTYGQLHPQPKETAKGGIKFVKVTAVISQFNLSKTTLGIQYTENLGIGERRGDIFTSRLGIVSA